MTVRRMLSELDSRELAEWAAFYSIEPFGYLRSADLPAGIIASAIVNCNRAKKSDPIASPFDFIPDWEATENKPRSSMDMKQEMMSWAAQHNAGLKK